MIPSLIEQVVAARIPSPQARVHKQRVDERKEKLCELLVGRNVTVPFAAQALGVGERTARDYLNALVDEVVEDEEDIASREKTKSEWAAL